MKEGGIHPHGDRKSPQVIESKAFGERPLRERVRKPLEIKDLNDRNGQEEEVGVLLGARGGVGGRQTRQRIACQYE
jgi:hypothetical protein